MMIPPAFSTGRTGRAPYQIAPDHRPPDPVKLLQEKKREKIPPGSSTQSKLRPGLGAAHCCAGCCTRGRPGLQQHC
ncbi:hypothetical protein GQ55_5G032000 [Panicum hallii var. hallii]|uniref:Uncharacterized protein n=1 Tax=Panicum hallii var. hallii TaxID=1504633 RepID=A0A2T7DC62_9POAL|nr:hypothetical protein GQ55_5G032000 [Panicum hallii var. hallii]